MANETITTSIDELAKYAIAEARLVQKNRQDLKEYLTQRIMGEGELAVRFPKYANQTATSLSEGSQVANSEVTTAGTLLTPGVGAAWATFITDLAKLASPQAWVDFGRIAADAIIAKRNRDIFALFDGFSTTVGTSNTDLTVAVLRTGVKKLLKAGGAGPIFFVFTPEVWDNLMANLASTSGANSIVSDAMKDKILGGAVDMNYTLFGAIPICCTSGVDESGDVKCGLFRREALGYAEAWDFKFEVQRQAKGVGWDIVATAGYAVGEIDDTQGVEVIADGE